jgi:hypothetical protein
MKHIFIALVLILTFIGCESGGQKDEIIIKRNLFYSEKYPITTDQKVGGLNPSGVTQKINYIYEFFSK